MLTLKIGEDSHFDSYFSDGLKPPTSNLSSLRLRVKVLRIHGLEDEIIFFSDGPMFSAVAWMFKVMFYGSNHGESPLKHHLGIRLLKMAENKWSVIKSNRSNSNSHIQL